METNEIKKDIATTINVENQSVVFTFGNGKTLEINLSNLEPEIQTMAGLHGLKQKLGDAGAISRNPLTGKSATVEDKFNAINEVYERLTGPDAQWNKTREGGSPRYGLLLEALIRIYPNKPVENLKLFIDGKSKAEQNALRLNPKISRVIDEIKLERAGDIDVDGLLDELE